MDNRQNQDHDIAIDVQNVSKRYRIGEKQTDFTKDHLASAFLRTLKAPVDNFRKYRSLYRFKDDEGSGSDSSVIWALKDISFKVQRGDVLGIVGRNGAGKSTLLKILSRITLPTKGRVEILGRVSSLLEVGTGFHPELSGRENIFLNGTILGMKKKEVVEKFDEIVHFSGVEKFLDTPVKRYSSGMKVRLAFSVAAHLEPEILLIDEVLAVGDAAFQSKCLGKMEDVARQGRTVLFVSHNMPAVANLCNRLIHLKSDHLIAYDDPQKGVFDYLQEVYAGGDSHGDVASTERSEGLKSVIKRVEFIDGDGDSVTTVPSGGSLNIKIHYENEKPITRPYFGLFFETQMGVRIFWLQTGLQKGLLPDMPATGSIVCRVPRLPVIPGIYYLTVGCGSGNDQMDLIHKAVKLTVQEADVFGTGKLPKPTQGMVLVDADWEVPSHS